MDRAALADIAHRRHPVAAPVDPGGVGERLGWLAPPAAGQVLDLGSGHGAWLLEPLANRQEALPALEAAVDDVLDLPGFLDRVQAAGVEPGSGHVSTLAEWGDDEWSRTGALVDGALRDAPTDADREQALAAAREHRRQWLGGYRSVLGLATVALHDVATPQDTRL